MVWVRELWQAAFARATVAWRHRGWQERSRAQWSLSDIALMGLLLALSLAVLWHSQGNAWVFCAAVVVAGQLAGAAFGVPFLRMMPGALFGSLIGLLFFAYAAIT